MKKKGDFSPNILNIKNFALIITMQHYCTESDRNVVVRMVGKADL